MCRFTSGKARRYNKLFRGCRRFPRSSSFLLLDSLCGFGGILRAFRNAWSQRGAASSAEYCFVDNESFTTCMSSPILTTEEAGFRSAVASGVLIPWIPTTGYRNVNLLALLRPTHNMLSAPWGDPESDAEEMRQKILATFDQFISDAAPLRLLFKEIGGKKGIAQMRILKPNPGARLIGAFLSNTVFLGAYLWRRDALPYSADSEQTRLAKRSWRNAIADAETSLRVNIGPLTFARPLSRIRQ